MHAAKHERFSGPTEAAFFFRPSERKACKELENPFGQDTNDISLTDFHMRFVDALQDVSLSDQQTMLHQPAMGLDPGLDSVWACEHFAAFFFGLFKPAKQTPLATSQMLTRPFVVVVFGAGNIQGMGQNRGGWGNPGRTSPPNLAEVLPRALASAGLGGPEEHGIEVVTEKAADHAI